MLTLGIGIGLNRMLGGGGGAAPDTSPLLVIVTGQSNAANMFVRSVSPPAAAAGTYFHDGTSLTTVPNANGCRELANALKALFPSRDIHLAEAATSGVTSTYFIDGAAGWTDFSTAYTNLGGVDIVICQHGEGDSSSATSTNASHGISKGNWKANWLTVSGQINTLAGATVPILFIGLSTYGGAQSLNSDAQWSAIQAGIRELCDEHSHIYYTHSMIDAVRDDEYHYDGATYGKSGKRAAATAGSVLGAGGAAQAPYFNAISIVSGTETDFHITHAGGSDFTPTTGITGLQITGDNGATWLTPSAAVRQSGSVVRATHTDIGTVVGRSARHMYGTAPDISGAPLDNSTLAVPIIPSAGADLFVAGSGGYPVPTFRGAWVFESAIAGVAANISLGPNTASEELVMHVALTSGGAVSLSSATFTPSGGSAIAGTILLQSSTLDHGSILEFIIPAATTGLGKGTMNITYATNPFSRSTAHFWTVPRASLSSTTPVDTDVTASNAVTSRTLSLTTSANGFIIAAAMTNTNTTFTWSGDETMVERLDRYFSYGQTSADASNVTAGTRAVTVTAAGSGNMSMIAASFR